MKKSIYFFVILPVLLGVTISGTIQAAEFRFTYATPFQEDGTAIVKEREFFGVISKEGKWIVPPQYIHILPFSDGLARVRVAGSKRYGFINKQGAMVIPAVYSFARAFAGERAAVLIGEKWGYINTTGKYVTKVQYKQAFSFQGKVAKVVLEDEKYALGYTGYINRNGQFIIPAKYEYGSEPVQGMMVVGMDQRFGIINENGKIVVPLNYTAIGSLKGKIVPAMNAERKWGFLDLSTGQVKIKPQFDQARPFQDGLAAVLINHKWGYINTEGKLLIKPLYDQAYSFVEGTAIVWIRRKGFGALNKQGQMIVETSYQYLSQASHGLFIIQDKSLKYGMMDKKGVWKIKPEYRKLWHYQNGLALAVNASGWGFIQEDGTIPEWSQQK